MYKILSIDGGGIKGIAPASLLAIIEETTGENIAEYFDLMVGTSTGGIIALGLGLGFSARELLSLYMDNGEKIFKKKWAFTNIMAGLFAPKNVTGPLQNLLRSKFKNKLLGQSKVRLAIPAFDIVNNNICIFKTSHHDRLQMDHKISAEDVALATCAAPYYFPPHRTTTNRYLVDGGMFANNPILLGVVEGLTLLNWPKEEIYVLSLGCSEETPEYSKLAEKNPGIVHWGRELVDLAFNSQSFYALRTAKLLLDDRDNTKIMRISPVLSKGDVALDDVRKSNKLEGIGHENARRYGRKIRGVFLAEKAQPFIPCHNL